MFQNRAAKIVTRAPNRTSRVILYDNLEWLTIHQMIAYHTVMNIYKIRTTQKPSYLSQLLNKENKNGNILLPPYKLELAEKSFVIRGSRLWNSLPSDLKEIKKIGIFKKKLNQWIRTNIPRFLD